MSGMEPPAGAVLRPGTDVAYVFDEADDAPRVYLARVPAGPPLVLDGPAALVWEEVTEGGTREEITTRVAEAAGRSVAEVAGDVEHFLDELAGLGLIVSG